MDLFETNALVYDNRGKIMYHMMTTVQLIIDRYIGLTVMMYV